MSFCKLRFFVCILLITGCFAADAFPAKQQVQRFAPAKEMDTRLRSFGIPYQINAANGTFVEVQLYVSRDQGKSWQFHARQNVNQQEFPFRAESDGEYWFSLKTLDRNRNLLPPGQPQPELKIRIDTVPPQLDFRIESDRAGRVVCRWDARDPNLDSQGLKIVYRADEVDNPNSPDSKWRALPAKVPLQVTNERAANQLAWWPETNSARLTVRMMVSDKAGNITTLDRQINVPQVSWRNRNESTAIRNQVPRRDTVAPPPQQTGDAQLASSSSRTASEPICENGVCRLPTNNEDDLLTKKHLPNSLAGMFPVFNKKGFGKQTRTASKTLEPSQEQKEEIADKNRSSDQSASPETSKPTNGASEFLANQNRAVSGKVSDHRARESFNAPANREPYAKLAQRTELRKKQIAAEKNQSVEWKGQSTAPTTQQQVSRGSTQDRTNRTPSIPQQLWKPEVVETTPIPRSTDKELAEIPPGRIDGDQFISESTTRKRTSQFIEQKLRSQSQLGPKTQLGNPAVPNATGPAFQQTSGRMSKNRSPQDQNSASNYQSSRLPLPEMQADPSSARPLNSRRFQLNYGIDSIDPSGVERVDLWITEDLGRTWKNWGTDPDARSPFPVEVETEGVFGFRVVIQSKDGLSGRPPASGQQPDILVHVDTQAPKVYITSVPYGRGDDAGRLIINWFADDPLLNLRPITLLWSADPQGPWTEIETGLRNTGRYAWKVATDVPKKVYLRIDATDKAGNVGAFRLTNQIDLSGLVPRAHIKSVLPVK